MALEPREGSSVFHLHQENITLGLSSQPFIIQLLIIEVVHSFHTASLPSFTLPPGGWGVVSSSAGEHHQRG
jgi:hypothetical protein